MRWIVIVVLAAGVLVAPTGASAHHRPTTYCSPTGDICQSTTNVHGERKLRIALAARYFSRYRLCVTAPDDSETLPRVPHPQARCGLLVDDPVGGAVPAERPRQVRGQMEVAPRRRPRGQGPRLPRRVNHRLRASERVMQLDGRVAIVTGGGTGLGAEVCRQLAAAGAHVGVNYSRSEAAARELAASLPTPAVAVRADVRDDEAVRWMVAEVERSLDGPVELLVDNAGVTTYVEPSDLEGISDDDWHAILDVNLVGTWRCMRAVAAGMRARGTGAIVNVASDAAFLLEGSSIPYVVSKVGVVALTRVLADALAPVRVNAVAPGWMDTPWLDRYVPGDVVDALRRGEEPVVGVDIVAREVVRLLADDGATGEVTQISS